MHRRLSFRFLADDRGVAMVEFALVLPVLLAIVLGIIKFGTAFNYWNDLNQIAADGARYAAVNKVPTGGSLTTFVQNQADTSELRAANVCVTFLSAATGLSIPENQAQPGDAVKITASYQYAITPSIGPLTAMTPTIRGNATMRLEQAPTFAYNSGAAC